jgi:copper ion binding protein
MGTQQSSQKTINVVGMSCDHCVRAVRDEITKIDGVSDVDVDLASGRVAITATETIDDEAVRAAVEEAGYEVTS